MLAHKELSDNGENCSLRCGVCSWIKRQQALRVIINQLVDILCVKQIGIIPELGAAAVGKAAEAGIAERQAVGFGRSIMTQHDLRAITAAQQFNQCLEPITV